MNSTALQVNGYFVMTWQAGRYGVVAWYSEHYKAHSHAQRLLCAGLWSGLPPTIKPSMKRLHP
jgi:hypothetical protein